MVLNRKRKTERGIFNEDDMREAVLLVKQNNYSIRRAANMKNVNYTTLFRYIKRSDFNPDLKFKPKYNTRNIFSENEETLLAEYLIECSKRCFGVTTTECRKLAYQLAIRNNL